jgi:hypothetical protein
MLYLDSSFSTPELIFSSAAVCELKVNVAEQAGFIGYTALGEPQRASKSLNW